MSEKLLPCPFCGAEAYEDRYTDPTGEVNYSVGCKSCGVWFDDESDGWNRRAPLAWTSDPPTVPGDYLFAYRWAPGEPWVQDRMRVTEVPVDIDTSETLWLGPIPELPRPTPAEGQGQGAAGSA